MQTDTGDEQNESNVREREGQRWKLKKYGDVMEVMRAGAECFSWDCIYEKTAGGFVCVAKKSIN